MSMGGKAGVTQSFTLAAVVQAGRLGWEALLLLASLRDSDPGFGGRVVLMEPQPGPLWPEDPRVGAEVRAALVGLGAEIVPFQSRHFGAAYPYGNKIEGLMALPPGPFLFLDTDTLVTGRLSQLPFDFARPTASMKREGTWPQPELYGPGYAGIWRALYDRFGLDFETSLDLGQPDEYWRRYLYFNAGWFTGPDAPAFGRRFTDWAVAVRRDPGEALAAQSLDPWLDQAVLPLVIHSLGGGRPGPELDGMDGGVTCHWRVLPLLYARESDAVVDLLERLAGAEPLAGLLKKWNAGKKMILQGQGRQVRAMFDRANLPRREQVIRNTIKRAGLWVR